MLLRRLVIFGVLFTALCSGMSADSYQAQPPPTVKTNTYGLEIVDASGNPIIFGTDLFELVEGGSSLTLFVKLTTMPIGEVEVFASSSSDPWWDGDDPWNPVPPPDPNCEPEWFFTKLSIQPRSLFFTAENFDTPVPMTISAPNNFTPESLLACFFIFEIRSSTDANYNGRFGFWFWISRLDNEIGLYFWPEISRTVLEGARLDFPWITSFSQPAEAVFLMIDPDEDCHIENQPPGQSLTISLAENFPYIMDYNYYAHDDSDIEGNHTCTFTFTTSSANPAYNNLVIPPLIYTIIDDDAPGILMMGINIRSDLPESTPLYYQEVYVRLTQTPSSEVIVTLTTDNNCVLDGVRRSR